MAYLAVYGTKVMLHNILGENEVQLLYFDYSWSMC
jgi:hypothetical protein